MQDKYEFDPDKIIASDIDGEPSDGYHICDGVLDYYYDAKEHAYYYLDGDNKRWYTSAGFIEVYSGKRILASCPICFACTHTKTIICSLPDGAITGKRICKVLNSPPQDVLDAVSFSCEKFTPDKSSKDYDLVMRLIKKALDRK